MAKKTISAKESPELHKWRLDQAEMIKTMLPVRLQLAAFAHMIGTFTDDGGHHKSSQRLADEANVFAKRYKFPTVKAQTIRLRNKELADWGLITITREWTPKLGKPPCPTNLVTYRGDILRVPTETLPAEPVTSAITEVTPPNRVGASGSHGVDDNRVSCGQESTPESTPESTKASTLPIDTSCLKDSSRSSTKGSPTAVWQKTTTTAGGGLLPYSQGGSKPPAVPVACTEIAQELAEWFPYWNTVVPVLAKGLAAAQQSLGLDDDQLANAIFYWASDSVVPGGFRRPEDCLTPGYLLTILPQLARDEPRYHAWTLTEEGQAELKARQEREKLKAFIQADYKEQEAIREQIRQEKEAEKAAQEAAQKAQEEKETA